MTFNWTLLNVDVFTGVDFEIIDCLVFRKICDLSAPCGLNQS